MGYPSGLDQRVTKLRPRLTGSINLYDGKLEPLVIRCAFTFEHAKDALNRIDLGRPLNNEQFRDACIWQDCVTYGKDNTVFFPTLRSTMLKSLRTGWLKNFEREITAARADVPIFPSIGKLYDHLTPAIAERDTREIAEKIAQELRPVIDESLRRHGFSDAQLSGQSISLKVTRIPTRQFDTFTVTFTLSSAIEDNERLAQTSTLYRLEGTCSFDVPSGNVHAVSLDREIVAWTAPDGKPVQAGTHLFRAHLATGAYASTGISFG